MSTNNSSNSGINFTGLLTVLFIGLKLANIIDWPWWWVLAPIWISILIILTVLFVALAVKLIGN